MPSTTPDRPAPEQVAEDPRPAGPRPADPRPADPRPGWTEIAVGLVGYLLLQVAAGLGLSGTVAPGSATLGLVVIAVAGVTALLGAVLAMAVRVRSPRAFGVRGTSWRWLLAGAAFGVLAWLAIRGVILAWVALTGDRSNPQGGFLPAVTGGGAVLVGLLLLGSVLVPFGEELLFRGVVASSLSRYGPWVAVLGSAAVFAIMHGISVVLPAAFLLGVVNVLLLRRTGSVWPGVVTHGVNNALVFGIGALVLS